MKPKVYLETTISSYLASRPSRDLVIAGNQELTHEWWTERRHTFDLYVSQYVLDEAALGDSDAARRRMDILADLKELEASEGAERLTEKLLGEGVVPREAATDAAHIAVATGHGMDFLLTWNCRHIANARMLRKIYSVCDAAGFICPIICTPAELMEGDEDENGSNC